jgi:hypothetical protein
VVTTDLTIYRNIYISYGRTKSLKNKNCPTHSQKFTCFYGFPIGFWICTGGLERILCFPFITANKWMIEIKSIYNTGKGPV